MNDEQIKQEAAKWLVSLRETAEHASGFVLDQAPGAMREFVVLGRVEHTAYLVLCLALVGLCLGLAIKLIRYLQSPAASGEYGFLLVVVVIVFFLAMIGFGRNFHSCLTAWFAPRIYLIETLADLAGKVAEK